MPAGFTGLNHSIRIGSANDPAEAEADRVADAVTQENDNSPQPVLRRSERESASMIPAPGVAGDLDFYRERMGYDFRDVRIHADAQAGRLARKLDARAFNYGKHVVVGKGEYKPGTSAGRRLMAHELTHVVQQRGAVDRVIRRQGDAPPMRGGGKAWAEAFNFLNAALATGILKIQVWRHMQRRRSEIDAYRFANPNNGVLIIVRLASQRNNIGQYAWQLLGIHEQFGGSSRIGAIRRWNTTDHILPGAPESGYQTAPSVYVWVAPVNPDSVRTA